MAARGKLAPMFGVHPAMREAGGLGGPQQPLQVNMRGPGRARAAAASPKQVAAKMRAIPGDRRRADLAGRAASGVPHRREPRPGERAGAGRGRRSPAPSARCWRGRRRPPGRTRRARSATWWCRRRASGAPRWQTHLACRSPPPDGGAHHGAARAGGARGGGRGARADRPAGPGARGHGGRRRYAGADHRRGVGGHRRGAGGDVELPAGYTVTLGGETEQLAGDHGLRAGVHPACRDPDLPDPGVASSRASRSRSPSCCRCRSRSSACCWRCC